jgi:2'-phosphotransferase
VILIVIVDKGMRSSSQVLVYIDVDKAISAGVDFFVSANGVVLTEGDERGYLKPQFFSLVENAQRKVMPGWVPASVATPESLRIPVVNMSM